MKTKIFTVLFLVVPLLFSAQTLTIESGATLTIGAGGSMTTGEVTNNAGVDGLVIESSSTAQGTFIFTGADVDATVQIYVPKATGDDSWHFVSPPITNSTAQDFLPKDNVTYDAWLYKFTTDVMPLEDGWTAITTPLTTPLASGTGYSYLWVDHPTRDNDLGLVTFKGPITASEVDQYLTYGVNGNDFHLIGNPYTATIFLGTTPAGMENSYWIWDGLINNYRWASTVYFPTGSTLDNHVAMGQSFFVKTTAEVTEKFLPEWRKAETTTFWKKSSADEEYANHIMLVASKGQSKDKIFVTFADDGTEDFENGYDISKLFGGATAPQLYMNVQDRQQSINYIASLTEAEERIIPIGFRAGEDGEQKFEFTTQYLVDATVKLEDTETGEIINLMENPVYTFTASPGDNEERFLLHFNWSPTGIEDPIASTENAVGIYAYDKAVYISNKDNNFNQPSTITIHDMYGRMIYSDKAVLSGTTRIPLNVNNTYLVVRVRNANGVYTNKVFIK